MNNLLIPKKERHFLPNTIEINWKTILPFFDDLMNRELISLGELTQWMIDRSELESILEEDFAWRYIRMTCDTTDEKILKAFEDFATNIEPKLAEYGNLLNQKIMDCEFLYELPASEYFIYIRSLKKQLEIFREENISIFTELQLAQQKYGAIAGAMSVTFEGTEYTLEQASNFLKDQDRNIRKTVYENIQARRLKDRNQLDKLFNNLIAMRQQVASNTGFENFRDYQFQALGRFDYNAKDCLAFHDAIAKEVVPILKSNSLKRASKMGLNKLSPFDTEVDITGKAALKPFANGEELIDKTIQCFTKISPELGNYLAIMKANQLVDLDARKGKAPGGYNYPLAETGAPFIFMNSANSVRDLTTMVHEGGHAIHTFVSSHLLLNDFKHTPSEVAELASMSMELISMNHWDVFFDNEADLKSAKEEQLKDTLKTLPWVATIDAFQHWLYTNPTHSIAERTAAWENIFDRFGANFVDWSDYPEQKKNLWQKQLHLFEVPFYYIEYAIAQLGAIAIYRNYLADPEKTLEQYLAALKLGYTKSMKEIYETAGIRFDFSADYIKELMDFLKIEIEKVSAE
jgi:oligoendopeptidase F